MITSFHSKSYQVQSETYQKLSEQSDLDVMKYKEWYNIDTVDIWRHIRMFEPVKIILRHAKNSKWLTVADGGFGLSAIFIEKAGSEVLATDIDTSLLKIMKEKEIIKNFEVANVEDLKYGDDSFEYIHCKSAYHHFPRPMIGLYEMIRVAEKAVVLTEPLEFSTLPFPRRIIFTIYRRMRSLFGLKNPHIDTGRYETVGNYIYSISEREMEKVCLGMNLPMIAFKRFIDHYDPKFEEARISENKKMFFGLRFKIAKQRALTFLGLSQFTGVHCIIFKKIPSEELVADLKKNGFRIVQLPSNPYI